MKSKITITIFAILSVIVLANLASAITIQDITITPQIVAPGESARVSIELENNFEDAVENVQVNLDLKNIPISPESGSSVFKEEIDEGDNEKFNFDVIADANAEEGVYKFPAVIKYTLNGAAVQEDTTISLTVSAEPNLSINSESNLLRNSKNKLQLQLTNTGLGKAKFLEVEIGTGNYNILSGKNVYIGDLDSNDFNTASFDLFIKDSGTIKVPITLSYSDSSNNFKTLEETLTLKAYSQEEALQLGLITKSNTGLYVSVVIALVILYLIYRRVRKWLRNRKKNNSGGK